MEPDHLTKLDAVFDELATEGRAVVVDSGVPSDQVRYERRLELRHRGQGHVIEVALPEGRLADLGVDALRDLFFDAYAAVYGHAHPHLEVETTTCRLSAQGPVPHVALQRATAGGSEVGAAIKGRRRAYFAEAGGFTDVPVYDRYRLRGSMTFAGPAIVEQVDSTAVIGPNTTVHVDDYLNLIVDLHYDDTVKGARTSARTHAPAR